ncbi:hypothetical protein ACSFCT_03165 [Yokenella regensburgei]|uniref:hypothetical protein n=1 Tax=Yokenella regensburgei TaxID=158877 RepID=UPI003EDA4191
MADPTFITYGGLIASTFSAIAAYLAIRQTVIQRKESIRPQLLMNDLNLHLVSMNENHYSALPLARINPEDIKPEIINSGLGTAINVNLLWEYPVEEKLNSISKTFELKFELNKNSTNKKLKITGGGLTQEYFTENIYSHNYLLPINIEKKPTKTILPSVFLVILLNELNSIHIKNGEMPQFIDGPSVKITFSDAKGKNFSINYSSQYHLQEHGYQPYANTYRGSLMFQVSKKGRTAQALQRIRKSYVEFMNEHDFNRNNQL